MVHMKKEKITLILPCAGSGSRVGFNKNKLLVPVNGTTILEKTLAKAKTANLFDKIIVVAAQNDFIEIEKIAQGCTLAAGGNTRSESVKNALSLVDDGIVLIHDGARPFVTEKIFNDCIDCVKKHGSAICVIPSADTIISSSTGSVLNYLGKNGLYCVQTPQGFFAKDIKKAYDLADNEVFNDDGEVFSKFIEKPHVFPGSVDNVKITFPEDFAKLKAKEQDYRFGTGFDCHKLVEDRKLILGGITIPHNKGLLGHSDADVLCHAISDAILSAAALRDIGYYFPDNDEKYKNADSVKLLKTVISLAKEKGFYIKSVSATVMAEKPKLSPFIDRIKCNLSAILGITEENVGVGATTLEGLGFVGREEGICVYASAVLVKIE